MAGTKIRNFSKMIKAETEVQLGTLKSAIQGSVEAEFLTVPEVAKVLNISYSLANKLLSSNQIEFIRIGRLRRVSRFALAEYKALRVLCYKYPEMSRSCK